MKKIILTLLLLMSSDIFADEIFVDGYEAQTTEVQEFDSMSSEPSVSPTDKARIYYNSTDDKLRVSENGGNYFDIEDSDHYESSIIPSSDDTYDLGSNTTSPYYEWRNLWIDGTAYIDAFGQNLVPYSDSAIDIGTSTLEWRDLHLDGQAYIDEFGQTLLPHTDNAFDLGSSALRFRDLRIARIAYIAAIDTPSITSTTGAISFGDENLTTTGTLSSGNIDTSGTIEAGSGNNVLTNAAGLIDGEKIQDDTIDDDSIDFADVTGADLTLTDCGAITSSADIQGVNVKATTNVEATSQVKAGTMTLSSGSISDTTGAVTIGNNTTISGNLSVSGNINVTNTESGHIKPSTDMAYELGGEGKRYVRTATKEIQFDPDTYLKFDDNFIYLVINGVEYGRWGQTAARENVVYGGENVIYSAEQVVF